MDPQWDAWADRARTMSDASLLWTIDDCIQAGAASWALERAGIRVSKTQGYYHDEISVYRAELNRRRTIVGV